MLAAVFQRLGVSVSELARRRQVSRATARVQLSETNPKLGTLVALATALGCGVEIWITTPEGKRELLLGGDLEHHPETVEIEVAREARTAKGILGLAWSTLKPALLTRLTERHVAADYDAQQLVMTLRADLEVALREFEAGVTRIARRPSSIEAKRRSKKDRERALGDLQLGPTATDAEARTAYRRLSKLYHPDVSPGHEDRFHAVQIAWAVIRS